MKEWTIMFYLNAKDPRMEPEAFDIFEKIAAIGSSDEINFLVEFGRGNNANVDRYGIWKTTLRYYVTKDLEPSRDQATVVLGKTDMGNGAGIEAFVTWGRTEYQADKYMLVIVDHGQGWASRIDTSMDSAFPLMFGSISHDADTNQEVYNRDIQDRLLKILNGEKLDIIGLDACCMAMIETAYAMRDVGKVMVASEDIEPPDCLWSSGAWLQDLAADSQMDAKELGKAIVESYQEVLNSNSDEGCLSAVDLSTSKELANKITDFVLECIPKLDQETENIEVARVKCVAYGAVAGFNGVDCFRWFDSYANETSDVTLKQKAGDVCDQIETSVFANFTTSARGKDTKYGSYGLAIYYPKTKEDYNNDGYGFRYLPSNKSYPVEFVQKEKWVTFLQLLKIVEKDNFSTYRVVTDVERAKLKGAVRTACNFWNRFVKPKLKYVCRLETFTDSGNMIAQSFKPYKKDGVMYGKVEFNTTHLPRFNETKIAEILVHELGHTLGYGWDIWKTLFHHNTGHFKTEFINKLPALENMVVELGGDHATKYAHWDEDKHDNELMTGWRDENDRVLPVTIDVAELLGHQVLEHLNGPTGLDDLLTECKAIEFTQQELAKSIDLDYLEETEPWEIIDKNGQAKDKGS